MKFKVGDLVRGSKKYLPEFHSRIGMVVKIIPKGTNRRTCGIKAVRDLFEVKWLSDVSGLGVTFGMMDDTFGEWELIKARRRK